jgi:hypothetical protein
LAGQSVRLGALPPACRKAASEKAVLSAWYDSLLAMDRLARLTPAAVRALAGPPLLDPHEGTRCPCSRSAGRGG